MLRIAFAILVASLIQTASTPVFEPLQPELLGAGSTFTNAFADYDGDGRTDAAVYRGGTWYINRSTAGVAAFEFGLATDKPVNAVMFDFQ